MAVFLDLEDDTDCDPPEQQSGLPQHPTPVEHSKTNRTTVSGPHWSHIDHPHAVKIPSVKGERPGPDGILPERPNPNKNTTTEALGCYPIIKAIASHIDLNTLDALSRTCRQVRENLLQFRAQLIQSTLHCSNEDLLPDPEHTFRYRARAADWYFIEVGRESNSSGKAGECARDLVGGCRRCKKVVCRNCTIKPPAPILLQQRYRRLCKTCSRASLEALTVPHSISPSHQSHGSRSPSPVTVPPMQPELLKQTICHCASADGVWLCQPCGRSLRSSDSQYQGIWKWRTRYLPSLGGLGVGIGEGNRGVECGREGDCLAAREIEQEIDCDAEDARESISPSSSPGSVGSGSMGPGYERHEIEGIGGVVKKKLVRMVRVGACVPEFEDERQVGRFLVREVDGRSRSWCGWCWRVVPGVKDREMLGL